VVLILTGGYIILEIGEKLSADAVALAVGVFLGAIAVIPVCFMFLAYERSRQKDELMERREERKFMAEKPQNQVVIIFGNVGGQPIRNVPLEARNRLTATPAKDEAITVETSSEWQDEPYPIIKR